MKKLNAALYTLLLSSLLFSSCAKIIEPEFRRVEKFAVKNAGFQDVTIGFSVIYYNPNKFGVKVKETAMDLYIDSVYVGKFTQPLETEVNERAEFSIPLESKVSLKDAFKLDITNLVGREVLIQARGNVKIGKSGVYVNRPIVYEGRQLISADLLK